MKSLYYADNNYTRYYVVEDWETLTAAVVDWDLDEEEEIKLIRDFVSEKLDYSKYEWVEYEMAYKGLFSKHLITEM